MYQKDILEDLIELRKKFIKVPTYKMALDILIEDIPKCHTFYFGNVKQLVNTDLGINKENPIFLQFPQYNKLPFKRCLFEGEGFGYDHPEVTEDMYPASKRTVYNYSTDCYIITFLLNCVEYHPKRDASGWVVEAFINILKVKEDNGDETDPRITTIPGYDMLLNIPVFSSMPLVILPIFQTDQELKQELELWDKESRGDFTFMKKSLMLLHTKNIKTEIIRPSDKINKKRIKHKQIPNYPYHVLKIVLPGNRKETIGSSKNKTKMDKDELVPFTWWRGHFKFYTEDRPLFGKHSGLYWWDNHMRGNSGPDTPNSYGVKVDVDPD